jgi:uncharacterized protein (TIGR02594 family)
MTHRGIREIPGKRHNPTIIKWLKSLKAWWSEDETPWCGTFVAHCLREAGIIPPKAWYRAKAYSTYGTAITNLLGIPFGAICVKSRKGGGHVFFAVARSPDGHTIYGLGGNQSNCVNITAFRLDEIDEVRWPPTTLSRISIPVATGSDIGVVNRGSES